MRCHRRGLTLMELLLAVSASAVIALAGTTVLTALTYAAEEQRDLRSVVGKSLAVGARVGAEIREAHAVLAVGNGFVVLWRGDADDDAQPSLAELVRIEAVEADQTLKAYGIADGVADVVYDLAVTDFATETENRIDGGSMAGLNWSRDVARFEVALDDVDAQEARLVSYRVTFTAGTLSEVYASAACLRDGGL
ncbi:MAG: prepilin-type N-terminal cleavage/methylation domain-containing protein [Phycisphaeraceae bacterium]